MRRNNLLTTLHLLLIFVTVIVPTSAWLKCTQEDAALISARFRKHGKHGDDNSRCPMEIWLEAMAFHDDTQQKLFVNIGFNKGYNFAIWANLFAPHSGITPMKWFQAIDTTNVFKDWRVACGQCHDCYAAFNSSKWQHSENDTWVTMIGVDLNREDVELVQNVTRILEYQEKFNVNFRRITLDLHLAAGSDKEGNISIPACNSGDEQCKIDGEPSALNRTITVPSLTVDKLVERSDLAEGLSGGGRIVDILMIDAEGSDPLVLRGTRRLFELRRVRCIVFEYHGVGPWRGIKLEDVVIELANYNFDCYFQGQGRLWPITSCWHKNYEFHWWSNVMCVQREDIWHDVLQDYIVDVSPILNHNRYEMLHKNMTQEKEMRIRKRLIELGYSASDVDSVRDKHSLRDIRSALHWLRFSSYEKG